MDMQSHAEMIEKFPEDWWKRPNTPRILAHLFQRYMIGLHLVVTIDGKLDQDFYTGFALFHAHRRVWATAGHVIDQLIALRENPRAKIVRATWLDHCSVPGAASIPAVDFANTPLLSGTPFGYDIGAASLRNVELMLAGNPDLDFFDEQGWRNRENAAPEGFYLIGFPSDWHKKRIQPTPQTFQAHITVELACVPVEKLERPSTPPNDPALAEFWNRPNAFFGRVLNATNNDNDPLSDIDGMSGGVLLSIERSDGKLRRRLFGIQSAWLPESRITRVEPIEALADLLEIMDASDKATDEDA